MEILKDYLKNTGCGFLKVDPLRDFANLNLYLSTYKMVATNINKSVSIFLKELMKQEEETKREFKKKEDGKMYEPRYGYTVDCLLPKANYSDLELKSIAAKFYKYVVGKETGIRYIAFKMPYGNALYLKFYFTDREYYFHQKPVAYTQNLYVHKFKKCFCKKTDELAVLYAKKGDVKLDKNGNKIVKTYFFKTTKSRIFIYGENQLESMRKMLLDFFFQAVTKVKENVQIVYGKFFRRMNLSQAFNRFLRRIVIANNRVMQYMQNCLNEKIRTCYRYPNILEEHRYGFDASDLIKTKEADVYINLFNKYQEIFRSGTYEHHHIKYKIKQERCDLVEKNLERLIQLFDIDLKQTISAGDSL